MQCPQGRQMLGLHLITGAKSLFFFKSVCLQKEINIHVATLHLTLCVLAYRIKVVIVAFQAQTQIQITYIWILQAKFILVRFEHKTNLFNLSWVIFQEFSIKICKMFPKSSYLLERRWGIRRISTFMILELKPIHLHTCFYMWTKNHTLKTFYSMTPKQSVGMLAYRMLQTPKQSSHRKSSNNLTNA